MILEMDAREAIYMVLLLAVAVTPVVLASKWGFEDFREDVKLFISDLAGAAAGLALLGWSAAAFLKEGPSSVLFGSGIGTGLCLLEIVGILGFLRGQREPESVWESQGWNW
jgi:hypothetical protein